ncbi:MAG: thioredoxin fold domain-containing protein [Chitinophagaceae bacterium]
MKRLLLFASLLPLLTFAQIGMQFEQGTTWTEIQAKAKAGNKYIFMDAYTTWCGPCKFMAATIFPMPEAGAFFNDKFINVKVQLDTTAKDNDEVKSWYRDAHAIMTEHKVNAFPTYLFFSPDGKLVHRAIGASGIKEFVAKGADALNPDKQYYVLLEKYKAGNKAPDFLRSLAYGAGEVYDTDVFEKASREYLATQTNLFTSENLDFIDRFTRTSKDPGFKTILDNQAKFDAVKGKGTSNKRLVGIIVQEELFSKLFSKTALPPNWVTLGTALTEKYPGQAEEVLALGKVIFFQAKKDWNNFQTAILPYMKKYGSTVSPDALNNYAWNVFENCKDITCVQEALEWSKRSFKDKENPMFIDTYANLLYKMGRKEEAIKWQEKAIALVSEAEKKEYEATRDKMKRGEKTWVE